jgi:hypothetical protein
MSNKAAIAHFKEHTPWKRRHKKLKLNLQIGERSYADSGKQHHRLHSGYLLPEKRST